VLYYNYLVNIIIYFYFIFVASVMLIRYVAKILEETDDLEDQLHKNICFINKIIIYTFNNKSH
jgi:hypothetical protein